MGDTAADRALADALRDGERVLWRGRPPTGLLLSTFDWFMIPFSIVWVSVPVTASIAAVGEEGGVSFFSLAFPAIFLVVGVYITLGRFVHDAMLRSRTRYALTDERALVVTDVVRARVNSVFLDAVDDVSYTAGRRGRGTVVFGDRGLGWQRGPFQIGSAHAGPVTFQRIEDARRVHDLAIDARLASRELRRG